MPRRRISLAAMPCPTALALATISDVVRAETGDASLTALAARRRRSPFGLHRVFRRVTGETPRRFTARLRVDRAAAELIALAGPPFTRYLGGGPGLIVIEAGMPTAVAVAGAGEVEAIELPAGPAAVALHVGVYDRLAETHAAVERWIDAERLERAGAPWEVYLTDPGTTPDPAAWQTEVVYPLAR